MSTLNIRIPKDMKRRLERLSRRQDRAASDVVRESLRRYLAVEEFRAIRSRALPLAEAAGYLTDEDVFRDIS